MIKIHRQDHLVRPYCIHTKIVDNLGHYYYLPRLIMATKKAAKKATKKVAKKAPAKKKVAAKKATKKVAKKVVKKKATKKK